MAIKPADLPGLSCRLSLQHVHSLLTAVHTGHREGSLASRSMCWSEDFSCLGPGVTVWIIAAEYSRVVIEGKLL